MHKHPFSNGSIDKQVKTQKGCKTRKQQQQCWQQNVAKMPKDKKKEAECQCGIRLRKKKETEKLKAFWAYAKEKIPKFVEEFLVAHEQDFSSKNHENHEHQETPQVTEDRETPPTIIGRNFDE